MQPPSAFIFVALFVALAGATIDARTGRIPNWLTLPTLALAPLAHAALALYSHNNVYAALIELSISVAGAIACAVIPVWLTLKGAIGGGDLKLFAAIGALCLPLRGIEMQLYAFVVGAVYAPVQMALQGRLRRTAKQSAQVLSSLVSKSAESVPKESMTWFRLGPSIFIGSFFATIDVWW